MGGAQHRGVNSEHGIFRLGGGAWGGRDVGDELQGKAGPAILMKMK